MRTFDLSKFAGGGWVEDVSPPMDTLVEIVALSSDCAARPCGTWGYWTKNRAVENSWQTELWACGFDQDGLEIPVYGHVLAWRHVRPPAHPLSRKPTP